MVTVSKALANMAECSLYTNRLSFCCEGAPVLQVDPNAWNETFVLTHFSEGYMWLSLQVQAVRETRDVWAPLWHRPGNVGAFFSPQSASWKRACWGGSWKQVGWQIQKAEEPG